MQEPYVFFQGNLSGVFWGGEYAFSQQCGLWQMLVLHRVDLLKSIDVIHLAPLIWVDLFCIELARGTTTQWAKACCGTVSFSEGLVSTDPAFGQEAGWANGL